MMTPIEVIFEHGVFRPLQPVELPEGATGQVLVAATPLQHPQQRQTEEADNGESPGVRAYRLLMEIAALPHTPPDQQTDVGERHDDFLYPKHGRMP